LKLEIKEKDEILSANILNRVVVSRFLRYLLYYIPNLRGSNSLDGISCIIGFIIVIVTGKTEISKKKENKIILSEIIQFCSYFTFSDWIVRPKTFIGTKKQATEHIS
jgi:hypothetical protein